jgi:hypothetical protein
LAKLKVPHSKVTGEPNVPYCLDDRTWVLTRLAWTWGVIASCSACHRSHLPPQPPVVPLVFAVLEMPALNRHMRGAFVGCCLGW